MDLRQRVIENYNWVQSLYDLPGADKKNHILPLKDKTDHYLAYNNMDLPKELIKRLKRIDRNTARFARKVIKGKIEPLPFWVVFPLYPSYSLGWRMGLGEEYLWKWDEYNMEIGYKKYLLPDYMNIYYPYF